MSPETADVKSSCPAESFFGSPEEVSIWNPAAKIIKNAIPPPIPTNHLMKNEVMVVALSIGIQPIAVGIPLPPPETLHVSTAVICD